MSEMFLCRVRLFPLVRNVKNITPLTVRSIFYSVALYRACINFRFVFQLASVGMMDFHPVLTLKSHSSAY